MTGLNWANRHEPTINGKYRFVLQDFAQKEEGFTGAKWQYWVDDGIDGKANGWYDYEAEASKQVERLYSEFVTNKISNMSTRWVDSGVWTYEVDLESMQ